MPGVPNGTVIPVEEEQHGEHHGPELQRTGRCVCVCVSGFNCILGTRYSHQDIKTRETIYSPHEEKQLNKHID